MKFPAVSSYLFTKSVLITLLVTGLAFHGLSQDGRGSITGRIRDSGSQRNCALVVLAILNKDSTLVAFTRSGRNGSWIIRGVPEGNYLVMTSHPAYDDYVARVVIRRDSTIDLGILYLRPKSDTLAAAIVTPKGPPIHIRGDTLDYNTSGIKMKTNATVEELLKRLPGVTVNQDGSISINGVRVQRLLVDGEDFFGGDPTIVTKNFNADMIARVQFLDKKSNQSEFTGVDDGQRTKTVNLVLKEDAKKGYFVQGEVGAGGQGYDNVNGMLGAFRGPRQLGVLAMAANTGATGFSGEGAGLSIGGAGDALGASAGTGIPQVEGTGVHYADKWNGNSDHLSGNASVGLFSTRPYSSTLSQQVLADSIFTQSQISNSVNKSNAQALEASYDYQPDSIQAFLLFFNGIKTLGNNVYSSFGGSSFNDTLVNSNQSTIRSLVDNQQLSVSLMWRIRSRKVKGRHFSATGGMSTQSSVSSGYIYVLDDFYQPNGTLLKIDTTDQRKVIRSSSLSLNGNLNYTEPVWKNTFLAIRYELNYSRSESWQSTFGRGDGKYQKLIDTLSNNYRNNVFIQSATVNLQAKGRPLTYTIGGDIRRYVDIQENVGADSILKYGYITFNPRADARYAVNNEHSIFFNYSAYNQQPSVGQLQPVQNNNNPLYISVGNPNLHSSVQQNFGFGFSQTSSVNFNVGLNYAVTSNSISTRIYTDSLGRQISQPVNVAGSQSGGIFIGINKKFDPSLIELGVRANLSVGRNVNYIGNVLSHNDNFSGGGGVSIGKYIADKYSVRLSASANYSVSVSSVNPAFSTDFWTQNHSFELSWFPIAELELNTSGNYSWQEKTSTFTGNNWNLFWNAYARKDFFQNRLAIKCQVNDILGQNSGIGRSIFGNTTTQTATNILGRYWMISASYHFVRHRKIK